MVKTTEKGKATESAFLLTFSFLFPQNIQIPPETSHLFPIQTFWNMAAMLSEKTIETMSLQRSDIAVAQSDRWEMKVGDRGIKREQ